MLSNINTIISVSLRRYSVAKTRHLLLGLDDDLLERASISRELLQRGVDYWPWQIESSKALTSVTQVVEKTDTKTVKSKVSVTTGLNSDSGAGLSTCAVRPF